MPEEPFISPEFPEGTRYFLWNKDETVHGNFYHRVITPREQMYVRELRITDRSLFLRWDRENFNACLSEVEEDWIEVTRAGFEFVVLNQPVNIPDDEVVISNTLPIVPFELILVPREPIKTSDTKHKIGVPKNKLP